jgi:hypothetical protein
MITGDLAFLILGVIFIIGLIRAAIQGIRRKEIATKQIFFKIMFMPSHWIVRLFYYIFNYFFDKLFPKEIDKGFKAIISSISILMVSLLLLVVGGCFLLSKYAIISDNILNILVVGVLLTVILGIPLIILITKLFYKE